MLAEVTYTNSLGYKHTLHGKITEYENHVVLQCDGFKPFIIHNDNIINLKQIKK